jgi:hypothetical protein
LSLFSEEAKLSFFSLYNFSAPKYKILSPALLNGIEVKDDSVEFN